MTVTAAQRSKLRRMCGLALTDTTYTNDVLDDYIEAYPLLDERGEPPYAWDATTSPPTQDTNEDWIATYDLNAAAADVWDEIAAGLSAGFDFSAEGRSFNRSQAFAHAQARARYYRSRRTPKTMTLIQWPEENAANDTAWIGNLPEEDD